MPLIDKVGLGLGVFMGFFMVFLFAFPRSAYARYYADLERRKLGQVVKKLIIGVFVLSVPYFYDVLLGFKNDGLSTILELGIGLCAILVLADVAWFLYQNYGPPTNPRSKAHRGNGT